MRQSFAASFFLNCVPAAAVGLMLIPPVTGPAAAQEPNAAEQVEAGPSDVKVVDPHEIGSGNNTQCIAGEPCSARPDIVAPDVANPDLARPDIVGERAYLIKTATPGGTMVRQGPAVAIGRLHPEFVMRLAAAIREARTSGLSDAGVFSAYRPPAYGVGGFKNKFNSLHAYGLAVDMHGIGAPGSAQARLWTRIAAKHGVACPYGVNNPAEWNHCQPTRIKMVRSDSPLVKTIAPQGPINPVSMFEAGQQLIESVAKLIGSFGGDPGNVQSGDKSIRLASRGRRVRMADARPARQHRNVRHVARKNAKPVRVAAVAERGTRQPGHRHGGRRERS
jgi:hypothetical protein